MAVEEWATLVVGAGDTQAALEAPTTVITQEGEAVVPTMQEPIKIIVSGQTRAMDQ